MNFFQILAALNYCAWRDFMSGAWMLPPRPKKAKEAS